VRYRNRYLAFKSPRCEHLSYVDFMVVLRREKRGAKVLGAYYDQRPFSVELVGAVCVTLSYLVG
jgi:hypothetical protein